MNPDSTHSSIRQLLGLPRLDVPEAACRGLTAAAPAGWKDAAACRETGGEVFFPTGKGSIPSRLVVRVCAGCPVRRACLASALLVGEQGWWAGTSHAARDHATARLRDGGPVDVVLDDVLAAAEPAPRPGTRSYRLEAA